MTKFIHKIKCICLDILSTWQYIRRCTELPEFFFFTLFFYFWLHLTMYTGSWGVPDSEHMSRFKHDRKVMNCAQLGCHSFRSYSYISRCTIMRNEVFVYLEIHEYGKVVQGVRFPDELEKTIENDALSAKWNVHIWNRLRKCYSRLYTGTLNRPHFRVPASGDLNFN